MRVELDAIDNGEGGCYEHVLAAEIPMAVAHQAQRGASADLRRVSLDEPLGEGLQHVDTPARGMLDFPQLLEVRSPNIEHAIRAPSGRERRGTVKVSEHARCGCEVLVTKPVGRDQAG